MSTIDLGGQQVIAWVEHQDSHDRLLISTLTSAGLVDRGRAVDLTETLSGTFQTASAPSMAYDGQTLLVALTVFSGKTAGLYLTRLDRNLALLDRTPMPMGSASIAPLLPPVVTWNGTDFLVVWGDKVTTVHPSGVPAGILSLAAQGASSTRIAAASVGRETHFVSIDYRAAVQLPCWFYYPCPSPVPGSSTLRALTVDDHGLFLVSGSTDGGSVPTTGWLALASSSNGSLAALILSNQLQSLRIDGKGNMDRPQPVATMSIDAAMVVVAGTGGEWLVVYENGPAGEKEPSLFGAFFDAEGKLLTPPLRLTAGAALSPSLLPLGNGVYRLTFAHPNGTAMDIETMVVSSHAPGRTRTVR